MRSAALLLLLAAPCVLGVTMPANCGTGSTGNVTCYGGAYFKTAVGLIVPGTSATLPSLPYGANTVCITWSFHCTPAMAAVVAFANATNPLVGQALPCYAQTLNLTAVVATGMDAAVCAAGLPTVTLLASFLDSWRACTGNNCNTLTASPAFAVRPVALVVAVTLAMLAAF